MESQIELAEVDEAIDSQPTHKSAGPDGLSAKFDKRFKTALNPFLLGFFQEAYRVNGLPLSFGKSHTVLIPKTEDPDKIKFVTGYRPITLCNVDYKIFEEILTNGMQSVISDIVGEHQTCGIRGRTIQTNTDIARSGSNCCIKGQSRIAVMQIDFEKAFDRVSHDVLFNVLEHVRFGKTTLDRVKMAYQNSTTRLIINKSLNKNTRVLSFVRQECPMSPLL